MLIQLISVPLLTAAWGLDGFGLWLMISTIPAYLAMSDFGLATAAGIDITRAVARKDHPAALRAFQTIWLFITTVTCLVGVIVALGLAIWIGLTTTEVTDGVARHDTAGAAAFLTLGAIFGTQMSILKATYQATHKYALGTLLIDLGIPLNGIAVISVALAGGGLMAAAAASAMVSAGMLMIYARVLTHLEPWCRIGVAHANRADLRRLLHPSLAAFALTAANSFGLHGVVLAIGWTMGPAAAAVFATARMLSRIPLQFAGLLARASLPELTRSLVNDNTSLTRRLMRVNVAATLAVMVPSLLVLVVGGPELLSYMSHGTMSAGHLFLALLALAALFNALWTTLGTQLMAENRQSEYAWVVLALYGLVALTPFIVGEKMLFLLAAMVVTEMIIALKIIFLQKKS